ncbi:MAG: hypothetical protein QOD42_1037 [Sphingomonadales bacterium]|jgi:hypothetical protein|nr:hypothetical protein [Sphingomonadales bacterium]
MGEEETPPILRLEIDNVRPLKGRDVGQIVERLNVAFDRFQVLDRESDMPPVTLRLTNMRMGSVIIDLAALLLSGAAVLFSFDQARDRMLRFLDKLKEGARTLRDREGHYLPNADEELIRALRRLLDSGDAIQILIFVVGENREPFRLDDLDSAEIAAVTNPRRREEAARLRQARAAELERWLADPLGSATETKKDTASIIWKGALVDGSWQAYLIGQPKPITIGNPEFMDGRSSQSRYVAGGLILYAKGRRFAYWIQDVSVVPPTNLDWL